MLQARIHGCGRQGVVKAEPGESYAHAFGLQHCKGCGLCAQDRRCGAITIGPEEI